MNLRGAMQPPLKNFFSKSGGVDRCSTPPSKIQGGLRPPPLFGAPVRDTTIGNIQYVRCRKLSLSN